MMYFASSGNISNSPCCMCLSSYLTFGRLRYHQIIIFPSTAIVTVKSSLSGITAVALRINFSVSWIMKKSFWNDKGEDEMRKSHCILAVHQYEREVWMYCISEPHKGLYKARIRPREWRGTDRRAAALTELCIDSAFDHLGFFSCDVLLLSSH